ncbi:hypothetical protein AUC68_04220 [Methyloceanibacter methanicus]|uniref:Uncharacterized protein n=1 Tax=Methyloceanibacter methanicus TaxID=1774968 RepID=A0A1E3W0B3_9HYPH|nr:hypothetical protein [Methyloceanibacter methanicus]ODR99220.1 hypothetical protein AUC68_04220 [Methyloceanibacter methanicus]
MLAATLLAAAAAPAVAQDVPGLRGSIGSTPVDSTTGVGATAPSTPLGAGTAAPPRRQRAFQLRGGILDDAAGGGATEDGGLGGDGSGQDGSGQDGSGQDGLTNDLATQPAISDPLGGIGDDTGTSQTTRSARPDVTNELRPSTVDPGLRGTVVADEAVPGFGIDEERTDRRARRIPSARPC